MTSTEQETRRKVEYGVLAVEDSLPEKPVGQGRPSPLMETVDRVMNDPKMVGKAVCIAVYESKTACGAAANVLRQRFGRTMKVRGVEFATRKHTVRGENGEVEDRHGLWMVSDPTQIVPGEWEAHVASEQKRLANLEKKRAAKEAAAAPADVPGADQNGGVQASSTESTGGAAKQGGGKARSAPARA